MKEYENHYQTILSVADQNGKVFEQYTPSPHSVLDKI